MTKARQKLLTLFTAVILLCLCVGIFAACGGSKGGSVTFYADGKEQVVEIADDGTVAVPTVTKEFYNFRGWYTDETYTTAYDAKSAKDGDKAYAYFVSVKTEIYVNGHDEGEKELMDLSALTATYEKAAEDKNLTFDGWYVDAGFTTKYTTQDADSLYGREMALVTLDNGYETVYTELVQIDTAMAKPKAEEIVKFYMDDEDVSYVGADGKAFDFTAEIAANTTIKVLWKTPGLVYEKISGSNYAVKGISTKYSYNEVGTWPVVSVLSQNVTVDDNGTKGNVVALVNGVSTSSASNFAFAGAYKFIVNEGVKYISGLNGMVYMEEVELPSTLKILEESFWRCNALKSLTIPNGVEVIIDCFWATMDNNAHNSYRGNSNYDFDITIPASVTNLVLAPTGLTFAENSPYFYENNRLYKKDGDGKILVSDYHSNIVDGTLAIPEGVTGIWVGALEVGNVTGVGYEYLSLPSTLTKIVYNADIKAEYASFYTGTLLTDVDRVKAPDEASNPRSYGIVNKLGSVKYVTFNTTEYPFGEYYYYFTEGSTAFNAMSEEKLVFVGQVDEGDITVTVNSKNTMGDGTVAKYVYTVATGTELTQEGVLNEAGVNEETLGIKIKVTSFTQFGANYAFGEKNANQYIDVTYEYAVTGFTYSDNGNGTVTVVGFDETTAQNLGTEENPGPYLVVVPNTVGDKTVVAIADNAFKDVQKLSKVYVANSVKSIGKYAFANTPNLEYVNIAPGGLEEIRQYAFYNAGAVYDAETESYVVNPNLPKLKTNANDRNGKNSIEIYIPLANLKTNLADESGNYWSAIGEYAFCTPAIACFQPVNGEEERTSPVVSTTSADWSSASFDDYQGLVPGMFFLKQDASGGYVGIYRYVSKTTAVKPEKSDGTGEYEVTIYDVQYVATAAGYGGSLYLGYTMRKYTQYWDSTNGLYDGWLGFVVRYELMEGSVCYRGSAWLGVVSKVHKNAFTHMTSGAKLTHYYLDQDQWLTDDIMKTQDSSVFEEGWWQGNANKDNAFMEEIKSSDPLFT